MTSDEPRIVLCDDDEDMRSLLEAVLRSQGFDATGAKDAAGVLGLLEKESVGAVVTDIRLKGSSMNGLELCRHLRDLHPELVVIVLSGHADGYESSKSCGAHAFLQKPVEMTDLISTLERLLSQQVS